jgi:copper resistance protein C
MRHCRRNSLLQDVYRAFLMTAIAVAVVVLVPRIALAHAVLVKSTPVANSTVQGPTVAIAIQYNSRVDGKRSTFLVADGSGESKALAIEPQSAPDTLTAHVSQLRPGKYDLNWQVLAVDGHITRGKIPFEVK